MANRILRHIFKFINRFFMVPLFRLGLGLFIGNPITGYIMVLKTIGRRTGNTRYAPVNYAIHGGKVYCMAGFGECTHWFRNLQVKPNIEILLPRGPLAGVAKVVTDSEERIVILRQLLKNSGFAGFLAGFNPYKITDSALREQTMDYPLVCIQPIGIGSGAADSGGWLWILSLIITVVAILLIFSWT